MNTTQMQGARNLGMVGVAGGGAQDARQRTLAERLESANNVLHAQVARVQNFVERVNGTPRQPEPGTAEKIATTTPMMVSVERTEMLGKMLSELADSLERIG